MMPVYSIIVPVYNAEKYLEAAVESVFAQKSASDYEIILVNDGSRDSSGAICDRLAAQDARIQVIHQVNQGVSAARNAGIAAAKGTYVLFLDSDDLLDEKMLETVDRFLPCQADILEFGNYVFTDSGMKKTKLPACKAVGEAGEAYMKKHEAMGVMPIVACWSAVFRRQFLTENRILFPLGVSYGEDFRFCMNCISKAKKIHTIEAPLYWFRVNELSVTHTPNVKKIRDVLSTCAEMYAQFPGSLMADYYCMSIWTIEGLSRKDAAQLHDFLRENRGILKQVSGTRARLARSLYSVFGWYHGAKLLRLLADLRKSVKGQDTN